MEFSDLAPLGFDGFAPWVSELPWVWLLGAMGLIVGFKWEELIRFCCGFGFVCEEGIINMIWFWVTVGEIWSGFVGDGDEIGFCGCWELVKESGGESGFWFVCCRVVKEGGESGEEIKKSIYFF